MSIAAFVAMRNNNKHLSSLKDYTSTPEPFEKRVIDGCEYRYTASGQWCANPLENDVVVKDEIDGIPVYIGEIQHMTPHGYKPNEFITSVIKGDYRYTRTKDKTGWNVDVLDRNKKEYGPIENKIDEKPITSMWGTFSCCRKMKIAPEIPKTVINCHDTFRGCNNLKIPPIIPDSVKYMSGMFKDSGIKVVPVIPDGVVNRDGAFDGCYKLSSIAQKVLSSYNEEKYDFTTDTDDKGHDDHNDH